MANCHNCERLVICPWANPEEIICSSFKPKHMTNADRLRSMTDEELADFLDKTDPVFWNRQTWLDWLKKEVT